MSELKVLHLLLRASKVSREIALHADANIF